MTLAINDPPPDFEAETASSPARAVDVAPWLNKLLPGVALAGAVAGIAAATAPRVAPIIPIPAMVIALFIGIALNAVARRELFEPGIVFCVKTLLRWAVALLGLRIAVGEIAALGCMTAVLVVGAMAVTLISGFAFARTFSLERGFGALAGAGTAICGASATLATSIVVPEYKGKDRDIAFVVVAVNTLSTVAMVLYPHVCTWLGFDSQTSGILLGATIHDVAQVVGAGYGVSDSVGDTAVVVKLFRVLLMLPMVLLVGWLFVARSVANAAKIPVPVFALVFLLLCVLNSITATWPTLAPAFSRIKAPLVEASASGLLIAISALGLGTSLTAIAALGWRHVATIVGTTLVILVVVTGELLALQHVGH